MSLDNLLRPRSLALNLYFTVMTCGVWLFVWAAARRRASAPNPACPPCGDVDPSLRRSPQGATG